MDEDFDESMDAFKKPSGFTKKRVPKRGRNLPAKKSMKHAKIGKQSKEVKTITSPETLYDLESVSSEVVPFEKFQQEDQFIEEEILFLRPCPTCGKNFAFADLKRHTKACLKANFAACKAAIGSNEILRTRPRTPQKLWLPGVSNSSEKDDKVIYGKPYPCPTCNSDLSLLSKDQRNTHANRCLDHALTSETELQMSSPVKKAKQKLVKSNDTGVRCLICAKELKSHKGLKLHYISCQKKNKFSTMTALTLNRPEVGEEVDTEVLAEIRRSEGRSQDDEAKPGPSKVAKKKTTKRGRPRKNIESYNDEMLRLALAVSNNENLENKRLKKTKKLPPPAMTSLSPNSKKRELQKRLDAITNPLLPEMNNDYNNDDDDEIPSTPALPTTALRVPSVRANIRVLSPNLGRIRMDAVSPQRTDDDRPGPSGLSNQSRPQQVLNVIPANIVMEPPILPPAVNYPEVVNVLQPESGLPPSPVMEPQSPKRPSHLPGELQSPEVSSSNIKNTSSDVNESPSSNSMDVSHDQGVRYEEVTDQRPAQRLRPSKWTMTARDVDSSFRVRGLLSQFEPRISQPVRIQHSPLEQSPVDVSLEENTSSANVEENDTNIDSTLMVMESLSNDETNQNDDASYSQPHSSQRILPLPREDSGSLSSSQAGKLSLENLLDQAQFSDAKILVGEEKEVIYLHQNILFVSCPKLLKEIMSKGDKMFWLRDFSKCDIMPLLRYFYSGEIDNLFSCGKLHKSKLLIQRFEVRLSEKDQQLIDSRSNEEIVSAPMPSSPRMPEQNASDQQSVIDNHADEQGNVVVTKPILDSEIEPVSTDPIQPLELSDPERTFEEELLPQNLTQDDPDFPESPTPPPSLNLVPDYVKRKLSEGEDESFASDCDMFDFQPANSRPEESMVFDTTPAIPTSHTNGSDIHLHMPETDSVTDSFVVKAETADNFTDKQDVEVSTSDLDNKLEISSQDSTSTEDSYIHLSQDNENILNLPDFSSEKHKPKKRKRPFDSPAHRKSKRRSLSKGQGHHSWRGCPCCQDNVNTSAISKNVRNQRQDRIKATNKNAPLSDKKLLTKQQPRQKGGVTLRVRLKSTPKVMPSGRKTTSKSPTASPIRMTVKNTSSPLYVHMNKRTHRSPINPKKTSKQNGQLSFSPRKQLRTKSGHGKVKNSLQKNMSQSPTISSPEKRVLAMFGKKINSPVRGSNSCVEPKAKALKQPKTPDTPARYKTTRQKKVSPENPINLRSSNGKKGVDSKTSTPATTRTKKSASTVCNTSRSGGTVSRRRSITRRERRSSSTRRSSKETVYVCERLPRFKQREHIKSRPGVANMMKNVTKMSKQSKKVDIVTFKSEMLSSEISQESEFAERISMSQPIESFPPANNIKKEELDDEVIPEPKVKKYRFKKLHLAGYASSSPRNSSPDTRNKSEIDGCDSSSESDISGYASDGGVFTNICFDDSFEGDCLKTPQLVSNPTNIERNTDIEKFNEGSFTAPDNDLLTPTAPPRTNTLDFDVRSRYFGPIPITPMPNYHDMETPEVVKHAIKFGLKKTLGKAKLRTKLQEAYLYKHLTASDSEDDFEETSNVGTGGGSKLQHVSRCSEYDDDLCIDTSQIEQKLKLELSRLSMSSTNLRKTSDNIYTFTNLTPKEVLALSTKVVNEMFSDGSLLDALVETKKEMGSIKRGSRQDQMRCWNIVTPGSSSYNPKLDAILCLSEEYQSAITDPLISCVVKNFLAYKKYQFDCVPIVCDRMQKEFNINEHS